MTFVEDFLMEKDAIFVADSHFKQNDIKLLDYFAQIPKGKQIFLLGDIFHLLVGGVQTSLFFNKQFIKCISQLTYTNQVIFLEGNHDLGIKKIWNLENKDDSLICEKSFLCHNEVITYNANNLWLYSYSDQPIMCRDSSNMYYILAHGDLWINKGYDFYRKAVNNPLALFFFKVLDILSCGIIYRNFSTCIDKKIIAEFSFFRTDFIEFMSHRISKYEKYIIRPLIENKIVACDSKFCIIEGHYHLGGNLCEANIIYNALHSCYFHKRYLTFKQDEFIIGV